MSKSVKNLLALVAMGLCFSACDRGDQPLAEAEPARTPERAERHAATADAPQAELKPEPQPGLLKPLALPVTGERGQPGQAAAQLPAAPATATARGAAPESPGSAAEAARGALKVKRLVVTTGIEEREPLPVAEFKAGAEVVYAFVELANEGDEQGIVITFEHVGKQVGHVELGVPAKQSRWRTWGRTRQIKQAGEWDAVVRTQAGEELARARFQVS